MGMGNAGRLQYGAPGRLHHSLEHRGPADPDLGAVGVHRPVHDVAGHVGGLGAGRLARANGWLAGREGRVDHILVREVEVVQEVLPVEVLDDLGGSASRYGPVAVGVRLSHRRHRLLRLLGLASGTRGTGRGGRGGLVHPELPTPRPCGA